MRIDRINQERGGSELSEYQIRFFLSYMVRRQISLEVDRFLLIFAHFLTFSVLPRIPINPAFHKNPMEVSGRCPLTRYAVTTSYH